MCRAIRLQSVCQHTQGRNLDPGDRFLACLAIGHDPGQIGNVRDPPPKEVVDADVAFCSQFFLANPFPLPVDARDTR